MEALVAAAGIVLIGLAAVFGAIFQAKHRGKAEGEIERQADKLDVANEIIEDVKLANAARDAVGSDSGEYDRLRNKYDRDKDKVGRMHDI